jgi:hypothetical protein
MQGRASPARKSAARRSITVDGHPGPARFTSFGFP